jgi:hypothetical protein
VYEYAGFDGGVLYDACGRETGRPLVAGVGEGVLGPFDELAVV